MPVASSFFFKNSVEFREKSEINSLPDFVRGIYVLYENDHGNNMKVVYIGMARGEASGAKGRLRKHKAGKLKDKWTHFSVFEVWDNIAKQLVEELEGVLRHIYARDIMANELNKQKKMQTLMSIQRQSFDKWHVTGPKTNYEPEERSKAVVADGKKGKRKRDLQGSGRSSKNLQVTI